MHQANGITIKKSRRRRRSGLSAVDEGRLRIELRKKAPSEPWVDVQFVDVPRKDERGNAVVCRAHDPGRFPPGGARTLMIACPDCGVITPPCAFEGGVCLDHAERANWGPSPSAEAIRALQWIHLRAPQIELEPESTAALKREIERYERDGK